MQVRFVAGFGPIVRDVDAGRACWGAGLGIALAEAAPNYWSTDVLAGVKACALWSLSQAAPSCFGTDSWPAELSAPQVWIELDVAAPAAVTAAIAEPEGADIGCCAARQEPWGQTQHAY